MDFFVFLAGTIWAVIVAVGHDYLLRPPIGEENNIAIHLARGDGFINPLDPSPRAGPTAWSPPVAPYLMAAVYSRWGIRTPEAITILMISSSAGFGALLAGVNVLGRMHFSTRVGLIAAGMVAVHPLFLYFVDELGDTTPALAMFVWILVATSRGGSIAFATFVGAAMGILSLTNASYLFSYPLIAWHATRDQPGRRRRALVSVAAAFCLLLTPWTVRNALEFHQFMYVRGGATFEMWLGNRPEATGLLDSNTMAAHPDRNPVQRALFNKIGEKEYFRRSRQELIHCLRADPWRFARLSLLRAGYLFVGTPNPPPHATPPYLYDYVVDGMMIEKVAVTGIVACLGLAGIRLAWRWAKFALWLAGAGFLAVAPFVVTSVTDRYLLPLWTVFVLFAAFSIETAILRRGASLRISQ
jgi:hypothetical protein